MTAWEMTPSEIAQMLGSFREGNFGVWGDADSGNFSGTACSMAARGIRIFRQLRHQRTRVAYKAKRSRRSSFRDSVERLGLQCSANKVSNYCFLGKRQPGNDFQRVDE